MRSLLVLAVVARAARAADPHKPHPHSGRLSPYVLGPPTVLLSRADEEELTAGKTIMRALVMPRAPSTDERREGGTRRLLMVRDVKAPKEIVLERIGDFDAYPRMVKGCDGCKVYKREERADGSEEVRCEYRIHALHMKFKYYMTHYVDNVNGCVVWKLDYDRESDLDDSVGYWHAARPSAHRIPTRFPPRSLLARALSRAFLRARGACRAPRARARPAAGTYNRAAEISAASITHATRS